MLQRCEVLWLQLLELGLVAGWEREQLENVQAAEAGGLHQPELAGHHRAAVAAVGAVRVVAEPAHECVERPGDPGHRPATAGERHAEAEPGDRRNHHGERRGAGRTVRSRIGERADQVEIVHKRPGVRVQEQERDGVRLPRRDVDEVHRLPVDGGEVVGELVHARLLRAPVEPGPPVLDGLGEIAVRDAVLPTVVGRGLRQPGPREAVPQVGQVRLGDLDPERCNRALWLGHGKTL